MCDRLNDLIIGQKAKVTQLLFSGAERRRFLDLGFVKGTTIEAVYKSPSGDPTAYCVRGTIIAIRDEDASKIKISTQSFDNESSDKGKVIALAGNPNVGKSTVFNALTGMKQHTGNWPGKTVSNSRGSYSHNNKVFTMVDIPGTYSLMATSIDEEVARDFICFGNADCIVIVVDATCLERNLNLVLQITEVAKNAVLCVNLLDEAEKKKIRIDFDELSLYLGIPVVGTNSRKAVGLEELKYNISEIAFKERKTYPPKIKYSDNIENAITELLPMVEKIVGADNKINARWLALKMLDNDLALRESIVAHLGVDIFANADIAETLREITRRLKEQGLGRDQIRDEIVSKIIERTEEIYIHCVIVEDEAYNKRDRDIDKIVTSKATGIPIMILLLAVVFWITIVGANYPSEVISNLLFTLQDKLSEFFVWMHAPAWVNGVLVEGVYRTLAWVVSVMLPPMAIFFPLFTLLEDSGYLPRIAFNLDKFFKKSGAHGKEALTMCMGFGCNACGVTGCRIIDSPRERLIAILTNNFVPCNGRFPTLITIISIFFVWSVTQPFSSILSTIFLTAVIVTGVLMTFFTSYVLSKTLLKGTASSFSLELPSYRSPQVGKVIVRSIFDRTLFVLGRAVVVAAPAGLIIWILSNTVVGTASVLSHCASFLDPFAHFFGLDGVILMAFILGFPANEIVLPIIIMSYMNTGSMLELSNIAELRELLINNGWTWVTALCTMIFSLMHFPCGTACWTIKKETGSWKWTIVSAVLPTIEGLIVCALVANLAHFAGALL